MTTELRQNALLAAEAIGKGFTYFLRSNPSLVEAYLQRVSPGEPAPDSPLNEFIVNDTYNESIIVVYRLLFGFAAEARNMLGADCETGVRSCSQKAISDDVIAVHDDHERGFTNDSTSLWSRLKRFFDYVRQDGTGLLPALQGGLFDPKAHGFLETFEVPDYSLARAIDLLSRTDAAPRCGSLQSRGRIDYSELDLRQFGAMYENLLDHSPAIADEDGGFYLKHRRRDSRRKRSGSYYTPESIVDYMVRQVLDPMLRGECRSQTVPRSGTRLASDEILKLKILDPAMGSGHFLISVTDQLARAYGEALAREGRAGDVTGVDGLARCRRLVAEHCIYGVDIDPIAVEIAKLSLKLFTGVAGQPLTSLGHHLKCGDSLTGEGLRDGSKDCDALERDSRAGVVCRPNSTGSAGLFDWHIEFPEVAFDDDGSHLVNPGFDAVIANPPYMSFSGRHKAREPHRAAKAAWSAGTARGWRSLHGLFMIRSLELAREGGLISMIVPAQVGHLSGYGKVRARMMESGELLEVRYWGEDVFEGVTTPSMTFVIARSERGSKRKALVIDRDGTRVRFCPHGEDQWYSSLSRQIYESIRTRHLTLRTFSDPGVHTGNVGKKLIIRGKTVDAVPILEGGQIRPFHCTRPKAWLNREYVSRPGEYFRISPPEVYRNTDIVLRQTADRPIAARHIYRCYFRNSVLALKVSAPFSVEYLLGVLNSEAAEWFYRASSYESQQRAFPQVKIHVLRRLPIPDPSAAANTKAVSKIEEIARKLESQMASDRGGNKQPLGDHSFMTELNRLVWGLYGLEGPPATHPA